MIKLSLVKFIKQFSWKRTIKDYNHLFFQGVAVVVLSIFVTLLSLYFYSAFLDRNRYGNYDDFWEKLMFIVYARQRDFFSLSLSAVIGFAGMAIAVVKLNKTKQLSYGLFNDSRIIQPFLLGLIIMFFLVSFFGQGLEWTLPDHVFYDRTSRHFFTEWLNHLISYLLPATGFYLAIFFLRKGLEMKSEENWWLDFFRMGFLYLVLLSFVNLSFGILSRLVISPLSEVFGFNLVGLVLVIFIAIALMVFYAICLSDLMLIIIGKKTTIPIQVHHPELLDQ